MDVHPINTEITVNLTSAGSRLARLLVTVLLVAALPSVAGAHEADKAAHGDLSGTPHADHGSAAEVGAKLSDPTSNVWAMFTQFGLTTSDGDFNGGDPEIGGNMIFQPIMPIPLFGEGADQWKLITRPTVPILFGNSVPRKVPNRYTQESGIGDITLPLIVNPPAGHWLLGLGPNFLFPSASEKAFGRQQWAIGPTGILGYKTKKWVAGVFPQYYFGIGSRGDQGSTPDASFMNLLYFGFYNLPDAWQIGFNPNITYDNKASSGNRWNVPIGLVASKTTIMGGRPWKFQFGFEYSVVSQDDYGTRFQVKLNIIPVITPLIKNAIFGGN